VTVDPRIVGNRSGVWERTWTPADSMLYALAVGAGLHDPTTDLAFTTENTAGVEQRAIPSFLCVLAAGATPDLGPIDRHMLLHAEQEFVSHKPLPVGGQLCTITTVSEVWDKGSGALIVIDTECSDAFDDSSLGTVRSKLFIRGAGGFGGTSQPTSRWMEPTREPDHTVSLRTRPEQALWYRLTGDRIHCTPTPRSPAGRIRPAHPARDVHLRLHAPGAAERRSRAHLRVYGRAVHQTGIPGRHLDGVNVGRRQSHPLSHQDPRRRGRSRSWRHDNAVTKREGRRHPWVYSTVVSRS
jgi:hypothetical protein